MMSWMLYSVFVAVLVGAAAVPLERALRVQGRPGRWAWLGATAACLAIPAVAALLPEGMGPHQGLGAFTPVAAPVGAVLGEMTLGSGAGDLMVRFEGTFVKLWAASSALLLALLGSSFLRLRLSRSTWKPSVVEGEPVLVSLDVGPAVVGVLRQRIVLPGWVLDRGAESRRLILEHEREHVRARDPLLVFLMTVVCALLPWNGALWWHLRRLRLAVEMDCDQRVLRGTTPGVRQRYGQLLLEVGRRTSRSLPALASFSEGRSPLGRRIRAMTARLPARPGLSAAVSLLGAAALVVAACVIPEPTAPVIPEEPPAATVPEWIGSPPTGAPVEEGPRFTPYTVAPDITNRAEIARALEREYPPLLRDAGIGGTVRVFIFIDGDGRVRETRMDQSSGHAQLDQAALRVAEVMRFTAALNRDRRVPVWISLPIAFRVAERPAGSEAAPERPTAMGTATASTREPTLTPYTVAPDITNRSEVQRALTQNYPPLLRDAGIGGTTRVHVYVGADGALLDTRIATSSGHTAIDEAALKVAGAMRFTAARNRDETVAVWLNLPVTFQVR